MKTAKILLKNLKKIWLKINHKSLESEHQYVPLAALGFFSFIGYYFIWHTVVPGEYENIYLRIIGGLICLLLMLKNYWPKKLLIILPIYWYITLLYCFPFFFTLMLFKNPSSSVWLVTTMTGVFLLMLLVDLVTFIIIDLVGIFLAWMFYIYTTKDIQTPSLFLQTLPTYITVIIAGGIFIHRTETTQKEKLRTMESLSASIAHELRTPLRAISSSSHAIKKCLPQLIEAYEIAKQENVKIPYLSPPLYKGLLPAFNSIESEAQAAFTFIDMLLIKVNESDLSSVQLEKCHIHKCIEETLNRYPFNVGEKNLINWNSSNDFMFKGEEQLTIHILFNLLKNSLYHIKAAGKGNITIWSEQGKNYNYLHFKDTGEGIAAKDLPRIFDRFFTKTRHGTGIGLAFCKLVMRSIGGDITCQSVEGEYAEFVLIFPKEA